MTETLEEKRERCKELISRKNEMEKEMDALFEYLERRDVKTFEIIDKDGYPNEDSGKIYEIRTKKNRIAILKTDYKELVSKIETLLHEIYGVQETETETKEEATNVRKTEVKSSSIFDLSKLELKLLVDSVMEESPAASGGLKVGDIVIKYGSVDVATYMAEDKEYLLEDVNSATTSSIGRPIRVEVVRGSESPILSITPNKWDGPGILGCHFTFKTD